MNRCILSIGTNSTRALAASFEAGHPPKVLLARSIGTRIGEGLRESGHLSDKAMRRTLDAVTEHVAALAPFDGERYAIATSAMRRAGNAPQFARRFRAIAGVELTVISGDDEARLSFLGATAMLPDAGDQRIGVLDTGGGSTEYAVGTCGRLERAVSCEIGAVRLTERCPALSGDQGAIASAIVDEAHVIARSALAPIARFPKVRTLVLVGGSATNTVALLRGSREPFDFAPLVRDDLRRMTDRLIALPLDERRALPGMNPQRADILPAGQIVLDEAFAVLGATAALASTHDLLLGYVIERSSVGLLGQEAGR